MAGDYAQAISIFKAATQGGQEKDLFVNLYFLGAAYYSNAQVPEAIAALEESLKHRDKASELTADGFTAGCYGLLGQAYLDNGQFQQAGSNSLERGECENLNMSRNKSNSLNPDPAAFERIAAVYYGALGRAHWLNKSYPGSRERVQEGAGTRSHEGRDLHRPRPRLCRPEAIR